MSEPEDIAGRRGHVVIDEFFTAAVPDLQPYQEEWLEGEGYAPFARPSDPAPEIWAEWLT